MKGKRPTRNQRFILEQNNLNTYKWLIQKDTPTMVQVVNVDNPKDIRILTK